MNIEHSSQFQKNPSCHPQLLSNYPNRKREEEHIAYCVQPDLTNVAQTGCRISCSQTDNRSTLFKQTLHHLNQPLGWGWGICLSTIQEDAREAEFSRLLLKVWSNFPPPPWCECDWALQTTFEVEQTTTGSNMVTFKWSLQMPPELSWFFTPHLLSINCLPSAPHVLAADNVVKCTIKKGTGSNKTGSLRVLAHNF